LAAALGVWAAGALSLAWACAGCDVIAMATAASNPTINLDAGIVRSTAAS